MADDSTPAPQTPHRRRKRYSGKNPRRFEDKYKERDPQRYAETVAKVLASGKTPAGTHRPIMVAEVLEVLAPQPAEVAVDCTLGYGRPRAGDPCSARTWRSPHRLDADPIQLPQNRSAPAGARLRPEIFSAHRSNFAGLPQVLAKLELSGVDMILADLGVSSMQIDDPARGFSVKLEGPLDMRMNPQRGLPASALLERISSTRWPSCWR
jgi:16S rRNA (cytosine1402-N4)-methyltransferase